MARLGPTDQFTNAEVSPQQVPCSQCKHFFLVDISFLYLANQSRRYSCGAFFLWPKRLVAILQILRCYGYCPVHSKPPPTLRSSSSQRLGTHGNNNRRASVTGICMQPFMPLTPFLISDFFISGLTVLVLPWVVCLGMVSARYVLVTLHEE